MAKLKRKEAVVVEEPGSQVSLDLAATTFLGTLPSDDTPRVELTGVFAEVYQRFIDLRTQFRNYEIDQITFGRALSGLICYDVNGGQWMIGASSGQWYHRNTANDEWRATPVDAALMAEARRGMGTALGAATTPRLGAGPVSPVTTPKVPAFVDVEAAVLPSEPDYPTIPAPYVTRPGTEAPLDGDFGTFAG